MNTPSVAHPRTLFRSRVDHASATLLRSVMADGWRPETAARELLATIRFDRRVLLLMRARLAKAALQRPTRITDRAAVTLELAITTAEGRHATTYIPRQGGAHA